MAESDIDRITPVLHSFFTDEKAIALLLDLWLIMQCWDDAEDGDPNSHHSKAYRAALLSLPDNPHYLSCSVPFLVRQAYFDWVAANQFESEKEQPHKSYMLRAGYYRIIISLIASIEGIEAAEQQAADVWRCYGETFQQYEEEQNA